MKTLNDIEALYRVFEDKYGYKIEGVTQQGSESWFNLKLGVISASNASKVVAGKKTATRQTYMNQLVAQVCTGLHKDISGPALTWGSTSEDAARATFEMLNETELVELPFVFKDATFREGASPDAVDQWGSGIEIKCPYASENHIAFAIDEEIKPEYQWQLQYTMRVCESDSWHFCSFDPRMKKNPLASKLVERDSEMQKKMDDLIPEFISDMDEMLKVLGFEFGEQWKSLK